MKNIKPIIATKAPIEPLKTTRKSDLQYQTPAIPTAKSKIPKNVCQKFILSTSFFENVYK